MTTIIKSTTASSTPPGGGPPEVIMGDGLADVDQDGEEVKLSKKHITILKGLALYMSHLATLRASINKPFEREQAQVDALLWAVKELEYDFGEEK